MFHAQLGVCLLVASFSPALLAETSREGLSLREKGVLQDAQQFHSDQGRVQALQRLHFEARFNRLVHAVTAFASDYSGGKGQMWPSDKAAALKKAIEELQKHESAFRLVDREQKEKAARLP